MTENEIPRRSRMDRMHPVELTITNTIRAIEEMGADERLTRAQNLLGDARDLVADFIDGRPKRLDDTRVPMILHCPMCNARHIDQGEFATKSHTTHACQKCGCCWRPAIVTTVGVQFLPGFKDPEREP